MTLCLITISKGIYLKMNIQIAICDDDKSIVQKLCEQLSRYQMNTDIDFTTDVFYNGKSLLNNFQKPNDYQVIFLDIEMPSCNGIELAKTIRNTIDRNVVTVFVSNYPQYMHDSFAVHPYHFITKPFTEEQIFELLDDIVSDINESHTMYAIIDTNNHEETINIRDILFFESINSKKELLKIHLSDRTIITKGIIATWEKRLSEHNFIVCHRGYLVNLIHIHFFELDKIILDNNEEIPVSRALRKQMRDIYLNRVFISKL